MKSSFMNRTHDSVEVGVLDFVIPLSVSRVSGTCVLSTVQICVQICC